MNKILGTTERQRFPYKPCCLGSADEELRSVSVWSCIGHGQNVLFGVLQSEVFVGKLFSVDGFPTSTVAPGEVTTLAHESRDYTVES